MKKFIVENGNRLIGFIFLSIASFLLFGKYGLAVVFIMFAIAQFL